LYKNDAFKTQAKKGKMMWALDKVIEAKFYRGLLIFKYSLA